MADIDLTTGSITIGDATFSKTTPIGAGTGNYDPFLTTQDGNANGQTNDGVAEGFNHDQTPILDTDDTRTYSLKLSDMPTELINGVAYYEFRVDLNENNSAAGKLVSLNEFKLYTSASPATLADFDNTTDELGAGFTKVYDLDAEGDKTLILKDDNSGSGTDDYSVLIKASAFGNVDPAQTYVTLYVNMGSQSAPEDGGFEEWTTGGVADSNIDTSAPTQTVTISSITDDVAPTTGTVADGGTTNDTAPARCRPFCSRTRCCRSSATASRSARPMSPAPTGPSTMPDRWSTTPATPTPRGSRTPPTISGRPAMPTTSPSTPAIRRRRWPSPRSRTTPAPLATSSPATPR